MLAGAVIQSSFFGMLRCASSLHSLCLVRPSLISPRRSDGVCGIIGRPLNLPRTFQVLWPDRFIASCSSWGDFWERAKKLPTEGEKGAVFERLTQLYLQTTPEYQTELKHVWTLREVPPAVRRRLRPSITRRRHRPDRMHEARTNIGLSSQNSAANAISPSTRTRTRYLYELRLQYMQQHRLGRCCTHLLKAGQQAPLDAQHDGDWPRPLAISGSRGLGPNRWKAERPKREAEG